MRTATKTTLNPAQLDQLSIKTIRFLSVDAVQKANSGHPGLPLGAAPIAYVLWTRFLRHNPISSQWPNRDRFVLSAGHGSMLLYSLLHLTGYNLPLDQIKEFRQWGSITPGHPERGVTPGVETTYCLVSDGDLMEGVASEAASLAGQLELGKLIYVFDDNHVTLSAGTNIASHEDHAQRFEAYGWHTQSVEDGNDVEAIDLAEQRVADILRERQPHLIPSFPGHLQRAAVPVDIGEAQTRYISGAQS
jgi:transketolase